MTRRRVIPIKRGIELPADCEPVEATPKREPTEREKWEAATAHIRKRYPAITWRDPITPEHTLAAMLGGLKLDFLDR